MNTAESTTVARTSGLRRFVTIVLATFGGSIACWVWVSVLLGALPRSEGYAGPAPSEVGERVVWFVSRSAWCAVSGAWCGLFLVFPALACLWNRRLFPSLVFVLAVGFGTATGAVAAQRVATALPALALAAPMTGCAVLLALGFVRFVPLSIWTLEPPRGT